MRNPFVLKSFISYTLLICFTLTCVPVFGQSGGVITVKFEKGQNIRELAQKHLGDPNLWTEILRTSNLTPADLKPGVVLTIDVKSVSDANKALDKAMDKIQEATVAGARLFTPLLIADAIDIRDQALSKRKQKDWKECIKLANESFVKSQQSLNICIANQNVPAEAVVNYRKGQVQSRKDVDLVWKEADKYAVLLEGEKVRTLSASLAGIMFRDDSHVRLEDNSQVIIQKMRSNLLDNSEEAQISLVEGDLFALLGGDESKSNFGLEVPGVDVNINSMQFWVGKDEETTRFANYDGEMEITSGGETVKLGQNQGSIVRGNRRPSQVLDLFDQPALISPADTVVVFDNIIAFHWEKIDGADSYWLEVALDKSFRNTVISRQRIKNNSVKQELPENQIYYWRVSAVDKYGLPGPHEDSRLLITLKDNNSPYLVVYSPKEGEIIGDSLIFIEGESEHNVELDFRGKPVQTDSSGNFRIPFALSEGKNDFTLKALDKAGNQTVIERTVVYLPPSYNKRRAVYDSSMTMVSPNYFKTSDRGFTMRGTTEPYRFVSVQSLDGASSAKTHTGENGAFAVSLPLTKSKEDFLIKEESPLGETLTDSFTVEIDDDRPQIVFDTELPYSISDKKLKLSGDLKEGKYLTINGEETELSAGRFEKTVDLKPGSNKFKFSCRDEVGNMTLLEKEVFFDNQAPVIINYNLSAVNVSGGETINLTVKVKDDSEIKKAAPYNVKIGNFSYDGILKLDRQNSVYSGQFHVPENLKGKVKLNSVTLEDYIGNSKEYKF